MAPRTNQLGQPIGEDVPDWTARPKPPHTVLEGRLGRLEPLLESAHAAGLHANHSMDADDGIWTYLAYGPFASGEEYADFVRWAESRDDPLFYAIVDRKSGDPLGVGSFLRIDPSVGSIEIGHLCFSHRLQQTPLATEALYLMMRHAFDDLDYRRLEWKCDSLNAPSRAAAERLGFRYEGTFRQAQVTKGRNRDTAWYSVVDGEWPALRQSFEAWLAAPNFDRDGRQRRPLREFRKTSG